MTCAWVWISVNPATSYIQGISHILPNKIIIDITLQAHDVSTYKTYRLYRSKL